LPRHTALDVTYNVEDIATFAGRFRMAVDLLHGREIEALDAPVIEHDEQ
jgi:hypothetical protein